MNIKKPALAESGITISAVLFIILIAGIGACSNKPPQLTSKASDTNPAFCGNSVTDTRKTPIPYLPKPKLNTRYTDPALGATVLRITNSQPGDVRKPAYSTMQAWNADESLLLIYRSTGAGSTGAGGSYELRDGGTYQLLQHLTLSASDIEELFWSHTNPAELFYISSTQHDHGHLKKLNLHTNRSELIADFTQWCHLSLPIAGGDVQMQSYDDDHFGFRCKNKNRQPIMFTYQVSTNRVTIQPIGPATPWQPRTAPAPTPGGGRYWYQGRTLSTELTPLSITPDINSHFEHSSLGRTADGQDAFYQIAFDPSPNGCNADPNLGVGHLVQHNLETGACRNLVSQQHGYPYPTSSTHVSALSTAHPGRVAMSSVGTAAQMKLLYESDPAPPLLSEIYLVDTSRKKTAVCRLAHHRSTGKNAVNSRYDPYFGEPHATISPSGTRIIFGSDWYDSGSVDSYVIELPTYQPMRHHTNTIGNQQFRK